MGMEVKTTTVYTYTCDRCPECVLEQTSAPEGWGTVQSLAPVMFQKLLCVDCLEELQTFFASPPAHEQGQEPGMEGATETPTEPTPEPAPETPPATETPPEQTTPPQQTTP